MEKTAETKYMQRALSLAARGFSDAKPNPMVGSVIVAPDGRIIGEGWHRRCGQGHAEVNAVASVTEADRSLLRQSTMYVTLEPCSHWGRTPPCANLILEQGIPHVVVATEDPFAKVHGRGISMLRDGGVQVDVGMLGEESRKLNAMFMTANELHRPFITLKWARSMDGFMDRRRTDEHPDAYTFSNTFTRMTAHRMRAAHQAVLVGAGTFVADHPQLNVRNWSGSQPMPVVLNKSGSLAIEVPKHALLLREPDVATAMQVLYDEGITSVLVEGGPHILQAFLDAGLWDCARVEIAHVRLGAEGVAPSPVLSHGAAPIMDCIYDENRILWYSNNPLFTSNHPLCL